jgi:excinuclease ABC subunit C
MPPSTLRKSLLAHVRQNAEERPAVYRMLSETGTVLYVGKAKRLRRRLLCYFRAKGRRNKSAKILRQAHAIDWEYQPSEFAALLREMRLIKQHRPRFNVSMNHDEAPRGYLALTNEPVPALRVVFRSDDASAEVLYGPFRRIQSLTEAARALADATGVRDCAGAPGSCLRAEIGSCACPRATAPAPRAALRGRDADRGSGKAGAERGARKEPTDYADRVALARDFLAGRSDVPVEVLHGRMSAAAEAWQFEWAGAIKARIEQLTWLRERLARFHADVDRLSFAYRAAGHDGTERVYLVRRGTVRAERPAPASAEAARELAALAARVFDGPDPKGRDIPTHDLDELYLVSAWFRKHPGELARTMRH